MVNRLLTAAIGLAAALPTAAGTGVADPKPLGPVEAPGVIARERGPVGLLIDERRPEPVEGIAVGRGGPLGMGDDLENLNLQPANLQGQQGNALWTDGSITGVNRWLGTTAAGRTAYAVNTAAGGNATKKARLMATSNFAPDGFFFGLRYELLRSNSPLERMQFIPTASQNVLLEHDLFVTSLDTMWTTEPIYVSSGYLVSRMLWGGTCVTGCDDVGLPTGPIPYVTVLPVQPGPVAPKYMPCQWIDSAPSGESVGDFVAMRTGQWVRVRHETTANGLVRHSLDFNDGTGFHLCYSAATPSGTRVDSLGANGSYEAANSPMYIDNIFAQGEVYTPPEPPQPLVCGPNDYSDDIEWLYPGPLRDQNPVWFAALSSQASVEVVGGGQVIRQTNGLGDNQHRVEFTRRLPQAAAAFGDTWTLCEETRFTGAPYATVRAFAPASLIESSVVTRLSFGHYDPSRTPAFLGRLFVQHNPAYNPIDDEGTTTPFVPGPNGNGGVARIGGASTIGDPNFDYYDTGVTFPLNSVQSWCVEVAQDFSMNITYGGAPIAGAGTGVMIPAFVHTIDELRHESENQADGFQNSLFVDNIAFDCPDAACNCDYPVMLTPYLDTLEWANLNVTIDANDDDGNPQTPFRWSSAPNMPVVSLAGKTQVLRMQNLFRDTTQTQGAFTLFLQAATLLPHVEPSPTRGYAAGASFKFTDGATTRAWVVAQADIIPGLFRTNAWVLYSAGSGTFWYLTPDPVDPIANLPIWVDTGRTLADVGVLMNQWFTLTIHRNLDGTFIFKINAAPLTDSGGAVVRVDPLQSLDGGLHEDLDRLYFLGGDDASAPVGSILYADNIRAWGLPCGGDTNDDGVVNFADINNILGAYNQPAAPTAPNNVAPDADGDGLADDNIVNFADLNAALAQFGAPCQ